MGKWLVLIVLALGLVMPLAACEEPASGSWRYKMTVTVETPEGIRTGSAVREMHVRRPLIKAPHVTSGVRVKGEAVVVDLGERGVLFALLRGHKFGVDHSYMVLFDALGSVAGATAPAGIEYYSNLKDAKATLTSYQYPILVTFTDMGDPKTVTEVEPDNLAAAFGEGVKLKDITIEMTEEPVTWGRIDEFLSENFWEKFRDWMKSIDIAERGKYIGLFTFKKGESK